MQRLPPGRVPGGDKRSVGVDRAFRHGTGREGLLRVQIVRRARVVPGTSSNRAFFFFSLSLWFFSLSLFVCVARRRGETRGDRSSGVDGETTTTTTKKKKKKKKRFDGALKSLEKLK